MSLTTRLLLLAATIICFLLTAPVHAQPPRLHTVTVRVTDSADSTAMPYSLVQLTGEWGHTYGGITGQDGNCRISVPAGSYTINTTYIGYFPYKATLSVEKDMHVALRMLVSTTDMEAVVITASEAGGMTSASKIGRDAMSHLQPSSFTDLLELLPGGVAKDPSLTSPNRIHLREAFVFNEKSTTPSHFSGNNYSTSSLGTSFMVDGIRVSANANLGYLAGSDSNDSRSYYYRFMDKGVDMRNISTDDIESVEIMRGIPSAEYGDLTSGLVKIERKHGGRGIEGRFKADMDSKLYYVGKGYTSADSSFTFNASLDYLDSKADPRNKLINYDRITGSLRTSKRWGKGAYTLTYSAYLDYTGSFDRNKKDPDVNKNEEDSYKSDYNRVAFGNSLELRASGEGFFRKLRVDGGLSADFDKLKRTKLMDVMSGRIIYTHSEPGVHDEPFLTGTYVGRQEVENIPFNATLKAVADFRGSTGSISHAAKAGWDWNMDKNYGKGQTFDRTKPIYVGTHVYERRYSDIPANHQLSFFVEDFATLPMGDYSLSVMAGLRGATMLNMSSDYRIKGRVYFDPRINAKLAFPGLHIGHKVFRAELGGGVGWHSKFPTMNQLNPNKFYADVVQIAYTSDPSNMYANNRSYIEDPTNHSLEPARNFKWEISGDFSLGGNRLSVTYFMEDMKSGFRSLTVARPYYYWKYIIPKDGSGNTINPVPPISELEYVEDSDLRTHSTTINGSRTKKEGVEFTFASERIKALRTRLTVTGAWMRTTYMSDGQYDYLYSPGNALNHVSDSYVAIFRENDKERREMFNTNFMLDTDVPSLGLRFSVSLQCVWYTKKQTLAITRGKPDSYMDNFGQVHEYTDAMTKDPYMARFVLTPNSEGIYEPHRVPFCMNVNLKATKTLYKEKVSVALYVNKLFDAHPDYMVNGIKIRRAVEPYFGMEINIRL